MRRFCINLSCIAKSPNFWMPSCCACAMRARENACQPHSGKLIVATGGEISAPGLCTNKNLHTALLPSSGQTNLVPNNVVGSLGERLVLPEIHRHEKVGSRSRQGRRQSGVHVTARGRDIRTKHKHLGTFWEANSLQLFFQTPLTGPGVLQEMCESIFEPLHSTATTKSMC